jgi:hypothetical protein
MISSKKTLLTKRKLLPDEKKEIKNEKKKSCPTPLSLLLSPFSPFIGP